MNPTGKYRIMAFRDWVPDPLRFLLFVSFIVILQFSNPVYLTLLGDVMGATQLTREETMIVFQTSMVGLCIVFPLLFRIKFRFTSQQIIAACALMVAVLLWVCSHTESLVILMIAAFFLGVFKMFGTFECFSSIQLIISPTRDFGVFFSAVYMLVLVCVQLSGILAVYLSELYNWKTIYYVMIIALCFVVILSLLLLRPFRAMKKMPLFGIDWIGLVNWSVIFFLINYIATAGETEDWLHSERIVMAIIFTIIFAALIYYRTVYKKRAYILPAAFRFKYVNISVVIILILQIFLNTSGSVLSPFTSAILKLDDLNTVGLNWWITAGIVAGAIGCFFWFYTLNGSFNILFAIGFLSLTTYHGLLYFAFSSYADKDVLCIPYFFRGMGNVIIYVGVAKYMTKNVGFDIFPQALLIVGIARNAIGGNLVSSVIGHWEHHLVNEYVMKSASKMDRISYGGNLFNSISAGSLNKGMSTIEALQSASSAMYGKVYLQALLLAGRDIFGWVTVFGILVTVGILLYHFSEPFKKKIPGWRSIYNQTKKSDERVGEQ